MGWDAFATKTKGNMKEFREAHARVKKIADSVDFLLDLGGLDCSDCARELENATSQSAWTENGWTKEQVKEYAANATWPEPHEVEDDRKWAVFSAKEFLTVCAKIGSGIRFSY